jgi:DNA-binding HxlR family transcriptional regulator
MIATPKTKVTIMSITIGLPFAPMSEPRTIFAPFRCPIARTLDVIGDRWTILILRDLIVEGPRKFQDFERSLRGMSPNTLSMRLKRLEVVGIVERRFYEQHPPRAEYLLTDKGNELRPVLRALLEWGQRHTKYRATT